MAASEPVAAVSAGDAKVRNEELWSGPLHWFADWPAGDAPRTGCIVYTIWDRAGTFVYAGMSGRSDARSPRSTGPFGRLNSHAGGRRSGDQFCVYVCDRMVLPRLHNRFGDVASGTLSLDAETRALIRAELGFRYVAAPSGDEARRLEADLRGGRCPPGLPLLNPLR